MTDTKIISLKEARTQGLTKYFTGKPCPKGHIAERYVAYRKCTECNKETTRKNHSKYYDPEKRHEYYEENKEAHRQRSDAWTAANPEKVKETHKNWRERNPDKTKQRESQWRKANPDKSRNRLNEWRRNNPAKYRMQKYRRRMLEVLAEGSFTEDDLIIMLEQQNGLCLGPNCETEIVDTFTVDHRVPLSRGGNNDPDNLQLLCRSCNSAKGRQTDDEWRDADPTGL